MAKAEIIPGPCGFKSTVTAVMNGKKCSISVKSECKAILKLGEELAELSPYEAIANKPEISIVLRKGIEICYHAACPVPVGIIKAVEVAARLAVPSDVSIKLTKVD
jgi:hypothetical protein